MGDGHWSPFVERALFLSLDGVDGAGKSTQLLALADWLRQQGHSVVQCRDPGGTKLGEALREIVLHSSELEMSTCSEMLLYMASRAELVRDVIRPAIDSGSVVLSDRFLLANVVYQGHAGGLPPEDIWRVGSIATGGLVPDLTFVLDLPADRAALRIQREPDRMEARGVDFMRRVRDGFLAEASQSPERIRVIDADRSAEQVQDEIRHALGPLLK